jgi:hypothetical protein
MQTFQQYACQLQLSRRITRAVAGANAGALHGCRIKSGMTVGIVIAGLTRNPLASMPNCASSRH